MNTYLKIKNPNQNISDYTKILKTKILAINIIIIILKLELQKNGKNV